MKDHITNVHEGQRNFKCDLCGKYFGRKQDLKKHKTNVHDTVEKLRKRSVLIGSENVKSINEPKNRKENETFKCEICCRIFSNKCNLRVHATAIHNVETVEKQKQFQCDICFKYFPKISNVKKHKSSVHEGEKNFKCDLCEISFVQKRNLIKHETTVHDGVNELENNDISLTDFVKCDICFQTYSSKRSLNIHKVSVHIGAMPLQLKNIKCEVCGKIFVNNSQLNGHFRRHHYTEKSECELCNKTFKAKTDLIRHTTEVHNKTKTHKCDVCFKFFSRNFHLKNHERSVHGKERNFKCDACLKQFYEKRNLRAHVSTVHEGKKEYHHCHICFKKLGCKSYLQKNVRNHEKEKKINTNEIDKYSKHQKEENYALYTDFSDPHSNKENEARKEFGGPNDKIEIIEKPISQTKNFKCEKCDSNFVNNISLIVHVAFIHEKTLTI